MHIKSPQPYSTRTSINHGLRMACSVRCLFMGGFQPDFGYSCAASGCLFLQSLADGLHSRDFVDHGVDNRRLAKCVLGTHYADDGIRIDRDLHWRHRTVCVFESHGAKQAGLLFSCHAVFSTILGYFLFSESMTAIELLGSALVFSGVVMAIFFGRRGQTNNVLEEIKGNIWLESHSALPLQYVRRSVALLPNRSCKPVSTQSLHRQFG